MPYFTHLTYMFSLHTPINQMQKIVPLNPIQIINMPLKLNAKIIVPPKPHAKSCTLPLEKQPQYTLFLNSP